MRQPQLCSMPGRGSSRAPRVVGLKAGVSAAKKLMKASRLRRGWLLAIMVGAMVGWSTAADAPRQTKRPPQLWAIVIGVENYNDPAIPDSPTAADHAQNIVQWFRAAGWENRKQLLLRDFGNANPGKPEAHASSILPTRNNLKWAVDEWLGPRAEAGDLVVFYFAGQAATVASRTSPQSEPRVDHYLLPIDARKTDVSGTGWSLDEVVDRCALRRIRVVCWLATGVEPTATPPRPAGQPPVAAVPAASEWLKRLTRWPGVTAWLASNRPMGFGQPVAPADAFTAALRRGLGDDAHRNSLAECLKQLQQDSRLGLQGFQARGRVPAELSLWKDQFNLSIEPPRPKMVLQVGHADRVTALACSADQRLLFSASMDSTVRAWSLVDGALLHVWTGQTVGATALGLNRGETQLVIGGGRGTVNVVDLRDFSLATTPRPPHVKRVEQITMLPDGNHFISIDRDGAALGDLRVLPLNTTPWPGQGLVCVDVACGGAPGKGTIAGVLTDGSVRIYDARQPAGAPVDTREGRPTALACSPDGHTLALGFKTGKVVLRNVASHAETEHQMADHPIRSLAIAPTGWIAVGHDRGLRLAAPVGDPAAGEAGRKMTDLLDRPAASVVFDANGRHVAACTAGLGGVRVWRLEGDGTPRTIHDDPKARASVVALTAEGRVLVIGGLDGKIETRNLDADAALLRDRVWTVSANRGKVVQFDGNRARRRLLVLTNDFKAQLWDLKNRTCRRLPGSWSSAVFLEDDNLALTASADAPREAGKVVRVHHDLDRARFEPDSHFFARTSGTFKVPEYLAFERLTRSPDGSRVAATAAASQQPLVCVWDTKTGKMTHWLSGRDDPVRTLGFSADARRLVTAGDNPGAQLWDLAAALGELKIPEVTFQDPGISRNVTCVAIRPGTEQVVTGHSDGKIYLWSRKPGQAHPVVTPLVQDVFGGAIQALTFTGGGRNLAAAGEGTSLWLGPLEKQPRLFEGLDALRPHHFERINGLLAWDDPSLLISGSDDTTVRFWDLNRHALWGTFSATGTTRGEAENIPVQDLDWVFFTPGGFFDSSAAGEDLVKFCRRDQAKPMVGCNKELFRRGLGGLMLEGKALVATGKPEDSPPISILQPLRPDSSLPDTELAITLGDAGWSDVTLFHNERPVATGLEKRKPPITIKTRLVKGVNRFAVMASGEGIGTSLSDPVEVTYDGSMDPSRLHIVALGVGSYKDEQRKLKYARPDASRISEVLSARGLDASGNSGLRCFLADDEVTPEKIDEAFREIAAAVRTRPQDKVVVFLAGHTGVFNTNRFCLLLPKYPFPADAPIVVAARGAAPPANAPLDPEAVLPYSVVALNLMRLKALDRLVIVDACQAEAILADPQVEAIQEWMEVNTRKSRTSYLMAARRGELAFEVDPLGHGLFTYTLLRGLGSLEPGKEPQQIAKLSLPPNADFNHDGILTTAELNAYVNQHLKEIAAVFPDLVRSREAEELPGRPRTPAVMLEQHPVLQSFGTPFPLVPLISQPTTRAAGN